MSKRVMLFWMLILSLTLVGCQTTPATPPSQPTTSTSGGTSGTTPATTSSQAAVPATGVRGGTARVALYQEPDTLNPLFNRATVGDVAGALLFDALVRVDPDGNYVPNLVSEVPSTQNGGISADGKTVTFKLRKDLKWSDGKPLTSQDVKFTYNAIMDNSNPVVSRGGYRSIETLETPDDQTVVLKFKEFYAPAVLLFGSVLPAHAFNNQTSMEKADFNRNPTISSGPFIFKEWKSAESMTFVRNPNYRIPDRPYLDGVIMRFTPSREASVAQLKAGEVDIVWDLIEATVPELEKAEGVQILTGTGTGVERLVLNFSAPGGDKTGDPSTQHPILGDLKVRQAIQLGINKKVLVDKLLFGKTSIATSAIPLGWAAFKSDLPEYSPDKAKRLLDESGWKAGSDGIRVKDGTRMKLSFGTTSGNALRERTQQVIQEQLKEIGIELEIKNMPSTVLFGTYESKSPRVLGNYDILMWTTNAGVDPQNHMYNYFHSDSIPAESNRWGGQNFSRMKDAAIDKAIDEAGSTPDVAVRKDAYARASKRINELLPHIFLYNRLDVDAFRTTLKGHSINPWAVLTWDVQNWYIQK